MAYSILDKVGDGSTTQFTLNFPLGFLDRTDVQCAVLGEVDGSGAQIYRTIVWSSDTFVDIGLPAPALGATIRFTRTTPKDELVNQYAGNDGATITGKNLEESFKQSLMISHEFMDGRLNAALQNNLDMGGNRITNIGSPVFPADAARKQDISDIVLASGNVPAPVAGDVNKFLQATGVGAWGWSDVKAVSVLDYGADPTGVTDSNAAFTAAANANRKVYIPGINPSTGLQAIYRLNNWAPPRDGLLFIGDQSRVHIAAFNTGTLIKKSATAVAGSQIIDLSASNSIALQDIAIDGVDRSVHGIKQGGDDHMFVNVAIRTCDVGFKGFSQTSAMLNCNVYTCNIGIQNPVDTTWLGGHITSCSTYGLRMESGSSNNNFDCRIEWNGHGTTGTGGEGGNISVFGGKCNTIKGTIDAGYKYNIRLVGAQGFLCTAVLYRGGRKGSATPADNCNISISGASNNVVINGISVGGYEDGGTTLYSPMYDVVLDGGSSSQNYDVQINMPLKAGSISGIYETGATTARLVVQGSYHRQDTNPAVVRKDVVLSYVDTSTVKLYPYNGTYLTIDDVWRDIPANGVALSVGSLAANQQYYVYAAWSAPNVVLEASTTAPVQNNNGLLTKSGDPSRTFVGLVRTNSSQFINTEGYRYVRSQYNEPPLFARSNYTTGRVHTGTSAFTETDNEIRVRFLAMPGDKFKASCLGGRMSGSIASIEIARGLSLDGSNAIDARHIGLNNTGTSGGTTPPACSGVFEFNDYSTRFITVMHRIASGSGGSVAIDGVTGSSTTSVGATTLLVEKM